MGAVKQGSTHVFILWSMKENRRQTEMELVLKCDNLIMQNISYSLIHMDSNSIHDNRPLNRYMLMVDSVLCLCGFFHVAQLGHVLPVSLICASWPQLVLMLL